MGELTPHIPPCIRDTPLNVIKTNQDAINLQSDIHNLEKWPANNCLGLIIEKFKFKHYTLIKNPN